MSPPRRPGGAPGQRFERQTLLTEIASLERLVCRRRALGGTFIALILLVICPGDGQFLRIGLFVVSDQTPAFRQILKSR
jgi:hypothetical protein